MRYEPPPAGLCLTLLLLSGSVAPLFAGFPVPAIEFSPREYPCHYTSQAPVIDGRLESPLWDQAPWSEDFVEIRSNELAPAPRQRTRARLLWDEEFLFVAAELEESDLWGTLEQRDAVIYHDNDFELFLDPDGDAHSYYELEINALGTVWDLLLLWPYRDGNSAVNAWDIAGLQSAVSLNGTLNDPSDTDTGWSVELALPWSVLAERANRQVPPTEGDVWRLNFSRVQWHLDVVDGQYRKRLDHEGNPLPEDNWVWSAQGLVAMHYPERWGYLHFLEAPEARLKPVADSPGERAVAWLWELYYRQMEARESQGQWITDPERLLGGLERPAGFQWPPELSLGERRWQVVLQPVGGDGELSIDETGRLQRPPLREEE